jgi:hypothetical protein
MYNCECFTLANHRGMPQTHALDRNDPDDPAASIDPVALVWLVQSEPKGYRFEGGERL